MTYSLFQFRYVPYISLLGAVTILISSILGWIVFQLTGIGFDLFGYFLFISLIIWPWIISKLKIINSGKVKIQDNGIVYGREGHEITVEWKDIEKLEIYFLKKHYWIDNFGFVGGYLRYYNLRYNGKESKEDFDKIIINGEGLLFKIYTIDQRKLLYKTLKLISKNTHKLKLYSKENFDDDKFKLINP